MALQITITDAGRAEVINAANNGIAPVLISAVGIGTGKYVPDPTQTALQAETKQLSTIAGQAVSSDTIHVTIKDETSDVYDVSEIGLYTDSGTLFAVYSDPNNAFMQKTAVSALMLSIDIILGTLDATNLTFGDTSFSNPPASETVKGVGYIASQNETNTGTDDTKFITPKKLLNWVKQATETVIGMMKVATQAQTDAGIDDTVAVSPKKMRWGFSISLATTGYIVFPSWMGGFIFQWARWDKPASSSASLIVNIPMVFPNNMLAVFSSAENGVFPIDQQPNGVSSIILGNNSYWINPTNLGSGTVFAIGY